jgi:hypothetical protein
MLFGPTIRFRTPEVIMSILRVVLAGVALSAVLTSAQTAENTNSSKKPAPGFSIDAIDKSVDLW